MPFEGRCRGQLSEAQRNGERFTVPRRLRVLINCALIRTGECITRVLCTHVSAFSKKFAKMIHVHIQLCWFDVKIVATTLFFSVPGVYVYMLSGTSYPRFFASDLFDACICCLLRVGDVEKFQEA